LLAVCKWAVTKDLFILADEVFATTISPQNTTQFRSLLSIRHQLGVKQRRKVIWMWSVSKVNNLNVRINLNAFKDLCLSGARFGLIHTENKDLQKALRRLEIMQPCAPVVQHLMGSLFSDLSMFFM
jgi:aspartate/methionine/tyrosine aminotransferase